MILGFLLANILMGVIGMLIAKQVVKISVVPMTILCPVICTVSDRRLRYPAERL